MLLTKLFSNKKPSQTELKLWLRVDLEPRPLSYRLISGFARPHQFSLKLTKIIQNNLFLQVITFVGIGDKGFRTLELKLVGPSLVGCGLFFSLLRILFCTVPSCCRTCCKCCRKTEDKQVLLEQVSCLESDYEKYFYLCCQLQLALHYIKWLQILPCLKTARVFVQFII